MCNVCADCEHKNKFSPESVLNICGGKNLFEKDCCGFVNPETMQGIFLSVCDEVNHPLVFIQKCNKSCGHKNPSTAEKLCQKIYNHNGSVCGKCGQQTMPYDNYYRLESNIFYSRLSGICKFVRKDEDLSSNTCGFQRCLLFDSYAAAYFLDKDSLPDEERARLDKAYRKDAESGREYLEYICKVTYYTEIAIPVMLEEKMVGVLIFGQILKKENEKKHRDFISKLSQKFADDETYKKEKKFFVKDGYEEHDFNKKVRNCLVSVGKLESRLGNLLEVYRKWYVDEISRELLEKFPKINTMSVPDDGLVSTEMTEEKYEEFKKSLWQLANSLQSRMGIAEMMCFVPDILQNAVNCSDELCCINLTENKSIEQLKFDFVKFRSLYPDGKDMILNQNHIKEIIPNLKGKNAAFKNLSYVLYISSGENEGVLPIAVLFGYNRKEISKQKEKKLISELSSLIYKIKDPVYVIASAIINQYMELEQRRFVQVMRHELGQSYAGYLTLMDQFERDFSNYFRGLENTFSHDAIMKSSAKANIITNTYTKNSKTFAHTAMMRVNGTRYSGGVQTPKKTYFYPYGQFLFKWNYIFSEAKKAKHLRFHMPTGDVYSNPDGYPLMYADPDMIEQVVFNLTNNAMKYSHFGSAVTLNCHADKNKYVLEVINYASPLSQEDKKLIFNYGYSGKNHSEKGSGLGLYISKEIAKRHGGELTVEQEIISDFNVPLLLLYTKDTLKSLFSVELYNEVQAEIERLKIPKENGRPNDWIQIIGDPIPQNPFTPLYIRQNLKNKTARIKFTLTIPLEKNNKEDVK